MMKKALADSKAKYTIRHRHPAVLQMVGCEAGLRAGKF
ncbi:hypothetical protein SAMN05192566_2009 [Methylophilus rhizosphaerae]|uniref:Uncharacterized protein n=1 Tax=Methylophilus rhizosphaerae TaxID=492660 RepID=A0A1G9DVK5_9PROT|nr:hypothetical protein SAMN05192566_2009 [Methylophilus rhizosphaerae]